MVRDDSTVFTPWQHHNRVGKLGVGYRLMKNKILIVLAIAATLSGFFNAGCNTVHGAGKDIEKAGDKIQDAADRNR